MASWTPLLLPKTVGLFDGSDGSSIAETGSYVSQWTNRAKPGHHASQAVGSDQPRTGVETLAGKNVISFTGGQFLEIAEGLAASSDLTVFFVAKTSGTSKSIYSSNDGNNKWVTGRSGESSTNTPWAVRFDWVKKNSDVLATRPAIVENVFGPQVKIGVNAGDYASYNMAYSGPLKSIKLGSTGAIYYAMNGFIAELIFIDGPVSVDEKAKIEGYLAHKWGLSNDLPANHPYKSAAPALAVTENHSGTVSFSLNHDLSFDGHKASSGTIVLDQEYSINISGQKGASGQLQFSQPCGLMFLGEKTGIGGLAINQSTGMSFNGQADRRGSIVLDMSHTLSFSGQKVGSGTFQISQEIAVSFISRPELTPTVFLEAVLPIPRPAMMASMPLLIEREAAMPAPAILEARL